MLDKYLVYLLLNKLISVFMILTLFSVAAYSDESAYISFKNGTDSLEISKPFFEPGEDIHLSFTASPHYSDKSWIGMFTADLPHNGMANNNNHELAYHYLKKQVKGSFTYTAPAAEGAYDFRMFESKNGKEVATIKFTVAVNNSAASLKLSKKEFEPGEDITLSFTASPHYPDQSWVGMFKADLPHNGMVNNNNQELAYHYLKKSPKGNFTFTAPAEEGAYDFRMFELSNGKEVATIKFTVKNNLRTQAAAIKDRVPAKLDTTGVDGIVDIKPTEDTKNNMAPKELKELKEQIETKKTIIKQQNTSNTKNEKKVVPAKVLSSVTHGKDHNESSKILFDGSLGKQWKELAAYGGDFKKFAKIENKVLVVDVPEGNNWGKTGIRSAEPLIKFPEKDEKSASKLTFTIDSNRSSDYILAIIPSNWDGNLEWRSHHIRVGLKRGEDNKQSVLALWIKGQEIMKVSLKPESVEKLGIVLRPDRLVLVTDGKDNILLQGHIPDNLAIYKEGYRVSVLTHAPKKDMSAKLALKAITLEQVPYAKEADLSELQVKPQKFTLFDGNLMGHRWKTYIDAKTKFDDTARILNGALTVNVPEKLGLANVGIQSSEPVIWLDKFGKDSKREVIFNFIPEDTTGFALALSHNGNHFIVKWFKDSEKDKAFIQIYQSTNLGLIDNWHSKYKPVWEKEVGTTAPKEVKLTLTPEGIMLSGDQLPEHVQTWVYLQANTGYLIYVYSFPATPEKAVKMALNKITLDNKTLNSTVLSQPTKGVDPLPAVEFFSGNKLDGWKLSPNKPMNDKPTSLCTVDELGFVVTTPPKSTSMEGCYIHPNTKIVKLDKRINNTGYKLSAYFDPNKTQNFRLLWSGSTVKRNWRYCELSLLKTKKKESVFNLSCPGKNNIWQRNVSSEWLKSEWNGKVNLILGKDWIQGELVGGPSIRMNRQAFGEYYIYVMAHDYRYEEVDANFLLKKLTGKWVAPDGMTSVDRWFYLDEKDFNPDEFLNELNEE